MVSFGLLFFVGYALAVSHGADVSLEKAAKKIEINSVVDKLMPHLSNEMKKKGYDPYPLPDITTDKIPKLEIGFFKGTLSGMSNLKRTADWTMSTHGIDKLTAKGVINITNLVGKYTAKAKFMGVGGEHEVSGSIANMDVTFDVEAKWTHCKVNVKSFSISNVAPVKVDIGEFSFVDDVVEKIIEFFGDELLKQVNKVSDEIIKAVLTNIDICALI